MDGAVTIDKQLMTSVMFIAVTMAIGEILRALVRLDDEDSWSRRCLFEIAMQFESIATTVEIVFVLGNYGPFPMYVLLILRSIWQTLRWEPGKSSIGSHALQLIEGEEEWPTALLLTSLEIVVAFITYPNYNKPFWLLFDNQKDRYPKVHQPCQSNMKGGLLHGSLAEGTGVFVGQVAGLAVAALIEKPLLRAFAATSLVFIAIVPFAPVSGSFFDPPLASAVQAGCEGVFFHEHLICYWISPIIGAVLGAVLFLRLFGNPHNDKYD